VGTRGPNPKSEVAALPRILYGYDRTLWKQLGPQLVREGFLCELYKNAFAMLCPSWG
jgi:hypothetical protein